MKKSQYKKMVKAKKTAKFKMWIRTKKVKAFKVKNLGQSRTFLISGAK